MRWKYPGLLRPLYAHQFSDGQLRFLCLCAALLSPRPPTLLALNEPETSLHPDLIDPLARLIVRASKDTQLWITTHSRSLADKVEEQFRNSPVESRLQNGDETQPVVFEPLGDRDPATIDVPPCSGQ